jgi:hypothetical protein
MSKVIDVQRVRVNTVCACSLYISRTGRVPIIPAGFRPIS